MGRKYVPIKIVLHGPTTEEGKAELAKRIGEVHGDMAAQQIAKLHCPAEQKTKVLQAIADATGKGRAVPITIDASARG